MERTVVVTGMGAITPLGTNVEESWRNVLAGKTNVSQITSFDVRGNGTQIAHEIKDYKLDDFFSRQPTKKI